MAEFSVWETIAGNVYACSPDDDVRNALKTMAEHRVRRLPVVNGDGLLLGILCMNDLILQAQESKGKKAPELPYERVMNTLKVISAHRALAS